MRLTDFFREIGRPRVYYPEMAAIFGNLKNTVLACYLLSLDGRQVDPDGWIYKSADECRAETGLTTLEQRTARAALVAKGFIEFEVRGVPATGCYKVNAKAIIGALEKKRKG